MNTKHALQNALWLLLILCASITGSGHAAVLDFTINGPTADVPRQSDSFGRVLVANYGLVKGAVFSIDAVLRPPTVVAFAVFLTLDQTEAAFGSQDGIRTGGFVGGDQVKYVELCTLPSALRVQLRDEVAYNAMVETAIAIQNNDTTQSHVLPLEQRIRLDMLVPALDRYTVIIVHCGDLTDSTISGRVELINPAGVGETEGLGAVFGNGHLPIELSHYPTALCGIAFLYGGLVLGWTGTLVVMKRKAGKSPTVDPTLDAPDTDTLSKLSVLHVLLLAVLFLHFMYTSLDVAFYAELAASGKRPYEVGFAADVVLAFRDTATVGLFQLTSTGWSINRGLSDAERQFTVILLVGLTLLGLVRAGCPHGAGEDDSNPYCVVGFLTQYASRPLFLISSFVACNWNINQLKLDIAMTTAWVPSTAKTYTMLHGFELLRWIAYAYAVLPTLFLLMLVGLLSWKVTWMAPLFEGVATFIILSLLIVVFHPQMLRSQAPMKRVSLAILEGVPFSQIEEDDIGVARVVDRSSSVQPTEAVLLARGGRGGRRRIALLRLRDGLRRRRRRGRQQHPAEQTTTTTTADICTEQQQQGSDIRASSTQTAPLPVVSNGESSSNTMSSMNMHTPFQPPSFDNGVSDSGNSAAMGGSDVILEMREL